MRCRPAQRQRPARRRVEHHGRPKVLPVREQRRPRSISALCQLRTRTTPLAHTAARLHRWLSERYPLINHSIDGHTVPGFDCFYLDMNGIVHNCSHPEDESMKPKNEADMMTKVRANQTRARESVRTRSRRLGMALSAQTQRQPRADSAPACLRTRRSSTTSTGSSTSSSRSASATWPSTVRATGAKSPLRPSHTPRLKPHCSPPAKPARICRRHIADGTRDTASRCRLCPACQDEPAACATLPRRTGDGARSVALARLSPPPTAPPALGTATASASRCRHAALWPLLAGRARC